MTFRENALAVALSLLATGSFAGQTTKVFTSPDGALRATITAEATGEAQVEIQASSGRSLLRRDERSTDGTHGHAIAEAAWTSNSQFFVASTKATGGHQPWSRPLWVYSRAKNRIFELWKSGVTATGAFTLKAPDVVKVPIPGCNGADQSRILVISLNRFLSTGTVPIPSCPGRL